MPESGKAAGVVARFEAGRESVTRLVPIDTLLKTGEVLERTGISHQVLYRYVTLGLIEAAEATRGGQRLFHPRVVDLIQQIRAEGHGRAQVGQASSTSERTGSEAADRPLRHRGHPGRAEGLLRLEPARGGGDGGLAYLGCGPQPDRPEPDPLDVAAVERVRGQAAHAPLARSPDRLLSIRFDTVRRYLVMR